jgi:hypothetical protein
MQERCDGKIYIKRKLVHLVGILKRVFNAQECTEWETLKKFKLLN